MATAKPDPADAATTREYIVLAATNTDGVDAYWVEIGRTTAATREDALETVVDKLPADEQEGTFVAIAARHWQPVSARVEVKRTRSWT